MASGGVGGGGAGGCRVAAISSARIAVRDRLAPVRLARTITAAFWSGTIQINDP